MHLAVGISLAIVAATPVIGRWRANVWLKKNMPAQEDAADNIPEIA